MLNTRKGTKITLPPVILYFSTLSGTNRQILTPKRYDEHPVIFIGKSSERSSPSLLGRYIYCAKFFTFILTLVPARSPHIDHIEVIDYSTIWIKWYKTDERYLRGILRGYRLHISQAENHDCSQGYHKSITFGPEQMEAKITGLPSGTAFRVWITAFTSVGEGHERHERWVKTSKISVPVVNIRPLILLLAYYARSPLLGVSISHTNPWSQPFPVYIYF